MRVNNDKREILRACHALFAEGQVVEVRGLEARTPEWRRRHTVAGYFDDWEKLAAAGSELNARGIYVTLNPVLPALLSRAANCRAEVGQHDPLTSDGDVLCRRWLPIDCDPVRPAGISASDEEHALALAKAEEIREYLAGQGWPDPLVADSGNGSHLLYRTDLPANDDTPGGGLTANVLKALAARFDDDKVKIDQKVANPARIWKLYGTVAAKGDHTAERPYRLSRLLYVPQVVQIVGRELLVALAAAATAEHEPDAASLVIHAPETGFDLARWIQQHKLAIRGPLEWDGAGPGGKKWVFGACPWNPTHRNGSAFITQLPGGAIAAGCHHNGCAGKDWRSLRALVEDRAHKDPPGCVNRGEGLNPVEGLTAVEGRNLRGLDFLGANDGTYLIDDGRMWKRTFRHEKGELVESARKVVADFAVRVVEESRTEDNQVWFTLAGETPDGAPLRCSLHVQDFGNDRSLLVALLAAAGARWGVHAGMTTYLRPAIQALSGADLVHTRCYDRTGWVEKDGKLRFLLPGRDVDGVEVRLRRLPYRAPSVDVAEDAGRVARGLTGFRSLLQALEPERTTVIATLPFQAPLARLAGWASDRYAVFIAGRTGSLKTSFSQALMCLYGAGFAEDQHLLKLGEGATRNALLAYAEQAHDLPLLVDNYKPNTGDGMRGLVNLLHNLIEGSGRERLNKESQLKEARPIACWPLLTGEDAPRGDAAAFARLLVVPVRWPSGPGQPAGNNARLSEAQAALADFPLLGGVWLDWLESGEGQAAAKATGEQFEERRAAWAAAVGAACGRPGAGRAANPLRLATNLATNDLTWAVLCQHPVLGEVAREFAESHARGLALLAGEMAQQTAENVEAARFVDVLRQLLAVGQCRLVERGEERDGDGKWRDGVIGWHAPDGGAYLVPDIARRAVEGVLGTEGLNRISMEALYGQLDELGYVGERAAGRRTKNLFVGNKRTARVLHLKECALVGEELVEPASA